MTKPLRAAVIGVGAMGANHARVYARMPLTTLVAVADLDPQLRERMSRTYKAAAYSDYREMLAKEDIDILTIALPTNLHLEAAQETMAAGIHTFVEKPLAESVDSGRAIIEASHQIWCCARCRAYRTIQSGSHCPETTFDQGQLGRIYQIHARRIGPFPPRIQDVGVVLDLATHELNVMEYLTGTGIRRLSAEVKHTLHKNTRIWFRALFVSMMTSWACLMSIGSHPPKSANFRFWVNGACSSSTT